MDCIYTFGTSSSAHTYGNVTASIREFILTNFPANYFKYISVSTQLAYRNMNSQNINSQDAELSKRVKPMITFKPMVVIPDENAYLNNILLTKNMDGAESGAIRSQLFPFLRDNQTGFRLDYKINRGKLDFDVNIQVSTLIQQIDLYTSMLNTMVWDKPFTRFCALESMIPRTLVEYMCKMANIDINMDETNIAIIMGYLNGIARYPITYKVKNSTGRDEFFMYYNSQLLIKLTDLTLDDGGRKGMADDHFDINFRVSVEFNMPASYMLIGDESKRYSGFKFDAVVIGNGSVDYVPFFTLDNLFGDYKDDINFKYHTSTMFQTDVDVVEYDELNIESLLNPAYISLIRKFMEIKHPIESAFRLRLFKDNEVLTTNWSIDWNTLNLRVENPDSTSTYRLIIYVNKTEVNNMLLDKIEDGSKDKPRL